MVTCEVIHMVENEVLKEYAESLPGTMTLKKKVIKVIMKSKDPLTQKEILDALGSDDWTNIRRVLRDLLDGGVIIRKMIGTKEYYVKISSHPYSKTFVDGTTHYFIDVFEPEYPGDEKYVRIKQAEQVDRDNFETVGKVSLRISKLAEFEKEVGSALMEDFVRGFGKAIGKFKKK